MTDIGWEFTKMLIIGGIVFAMILGFSAYGLWRMGPNDDIEEIKHGK